MKIRYRQGKEGLFGKPVLILQIYAKWDDGPSDSNGLPTYLAGEGWRDARLEDLTTKEPE